MKKKLKLNQTFGLEGIKRHPNNINKTVLILINTQKYGNIYKLTD